MVSYEGAGSIFFNDQYIYKEDLNNIEYTKIKTIRDSLAACIKQPGVAIASLSDSSLKVEYVDAKHFTVNPGFAIDKFGRLIYVPNDVSQYGNTIDDPEYHPKYPDRENLSHSKVPSVSTRYYANIYYNTQQDITESDDEGESYYTRDYDSYYIACEDFQAGTSSSFGSGSLGICLGSFEVNTSGDIRFSEITDMRPLLEVYSNVAASGSVSSSRRVFALSRIATNLTNALASNNYWAVTATAYNQTKADISYQHRSGSTAMNVRFCVPSYSQPSTNAYVYAYVYTSPGHILEASGSYNVIVNSQICDFSLDVSGLTPSTLYSVEIWMRTFTYAGTFYVRDLVIDVD
jgi:hypothetical protein